MAGSPDIQAACALCRQRSLLTPGSCTAWFPCVPPRKLQRLDPPQVNGELCTSDPWRICATKRSRPVWREQRQPAA